jgi:hypothetical protein
MTEKETLLAILVTLHVVEGAQWFQHGGLVLRRTLGGRFRRTPVGDLVGNSRGGLAFLGPLPPFDEVFRGSPWPCALSPDGVHFNQTENFPGAPVPVGSGRTFSWDELKKIRADEKTLRIQGDVCWRTDNVQAPERLAHTLRELARTDPASRPAAIECELRRRLDPDTVARTVADFRSRTVWMKRLADALFVVLLLAAPVVVWSFGWLPALWFLVPALYLLTGSIGELLRRMHRSLYPEAGDERFKLTLLGWLAPLVSIRAVALLSRPLLGGFHPLALAFALDPESVPALARGYWRDLKHPPRPNSPSEGSTRRIVEWHRTKEVEQIGALLKSRGLKIADLEVPPNRSDPAHRRYCPRCEAQFIESAETCAECGGMPLVALP